MTDKAFLLNRVSQLQARYLATYGDELTNDEVARYLSGLVADRQRNELAIFDHLPVGDIVDTLDLLTMREEPAEPVEYIVNSSDIETIVADVPALEEPKKRGRPKGWRKAK
jgi:hypothetical protein